jgi:hypothetical protein
VSDRQLKVFIVSTFRKTKGNKGTGTWSTAAGFLCRELLGERERRLYFHIIHISKNIKENG